MRGAIKSTINSLGLVRHLQPFAPPGAAVLRYHSVQDRPEDYAFSIGTGITHSSSLFRRQMEYVARHYKPVSLDEVYLHLQEGKALPRKAVVVTFDDGFADNYEVALPILDHLGIPATFYITVSSLESPLAPWFIRLRHAFFTTKERSWQPAQNNTCFVLGSENERNNALISACSICAGLAGENQDKQIAAIENQLQVDPYSPDPGLMLTWDQIRLMHAKGHIIGSHTLTHPNMAYVQDDVVLLKELIDSKVQMETRLNSPVFHFSYPSPILEPHWTKRTIDACCHAGYKTATTCTSGMIRSGDDPMSIKRLWVPFSIQDFIWSLDCALLGRTL